MTTPLIRSTARGTDPGRSPGGAWRGVITRISGGDIYIEIPRLLPRHEFGPCLQIEGVASLEGHAVSTVASHDHGGTSAGSHSHTITGVELVAGDAVIVIFVEGRSDEVVLLGRIG